MKKLKEIATKAKDKAKSVLEWTQGHKALVGIGLASLVGSVIGVSLVGNKDDEDADDGPTLVKKDDDLEPCTLYDKDGNERRFLAFRTDDDDDPDIFYRADRFDEDFLELYKF